MKCRNCGENIPGDSAYCAYCGADSRTGEVQSTVVPVAASVASHQPTTRGKRFFNAVLDFVFLNILSRVAGIFAFMLHLGTPINVLVLSWFVIPFTYYYVFEVLWSKTPAKFLTKTHVVTEAGSKPGNGQIALRTIIRFIPFEALSFLFASRPIGWHDSLSHTRVVDDV